MLLIQQDAYPFTWSHGGNLGDTASSILKNMTIFTLHLHMCPHTRFIKDGRISFTCYVAWDGIKDLLIEITTLGEVHA